MNKTFQKKSIQNPLFFLSPLSVVKQFGNVPLYGQIIAPFIGLLHLLLDRRISKISCFLLLLLASNMVSWFLNDTPTDQIVRIGQSFLMVMFFNFLYFHMSKKFLLMTLKIIGVSAILLFIAEVAFDMHTFTRNFFGISFVRYNLMVGEPNFSGVLFVGMAQLAFLCKKRWFFWIFLALSLLTLSRAVFITHIFWGILLLTSGLGERIFRTVSWSILALFLLYPLIISQLHHFLPFHVNNAMVHLSPRYFQHMYYSNEGLKTLWGEGHFQSRKRDLEYWQKYRSRYSWIDYPHRGEQHSLTVQVFSDFGWIGYFFFSLFIVQVFRSVYASGSKYTTSLLTLLVNFCFLNGLNEWIFYFFMACCLTVFSPRKRPCMKSSTE